MSDIADAVDASVALERIQRLGLADLAPLCRPGIDPDTKIERWSIAGYYRFKTQEGTAFDWPAAVLKAAAKPKALWFAVFADVDGDVQVQPIDRCPPKGRKISPPL